MCFSITNAAKKMPGGWLTLLLASIYLLTSGCAKITPEEIVQDQAPLELVWPHSPAQPRVTFLKEISFPRDVRKQSGFWARLKTLFVGEIPVEIIRPYGLTLDDQDNLYIADTGAQQIHVYNLDNQTYHKLPGKGEEVFLLSPIDVAVNTSGSKIFVSDSVIGKVYIFDADGRKLGELGEFERPTGLAYDREQSRLCVVDTLAHKVRVYTSGGQHLFDVGRRGKGAGEFNYPTNVSLDAAGNMMVTDSMNFRVQTFSHKGDLLGSFGQAGTSPGSFSKPRGVALDSERHIYVTDAAFDNIQIFTNDGQLLLHFGGPGIGLGQFSLPAGVVIDGHDRIYVADSFNKRIQVFQYLQENL